MAGHGVQLEDMEAGRQEVMAAVSNIVDIQDREEHSLLEEQNHHPLHLLDLPLQEVSVKEGLELDILMVVPAVVAVTMVVEEQLYQQVVAVLDM